MCYGLLRKVRKRDGRVQAREMAVGGNVFDFGGGGSVLAGNAAGILAAGFMCAVNAQDKVLRYVPVQVVELITAGRLKVLLVCVS